MSVEGFETTENRDATCGNSTFKRENRPAEGGDPEQTCGGFPFDRSNVDSRRAIRPGFFYRGRLHALVLHCPEAAS